MKHTPLKELASFHHGAGLTRIIVFLKEIGNTRLVAVAFKVVKDQLTKLHVKREIVATASAKQWFASNPLIEDEVKMNPRVYSKDFNDVWEWEMTCVAVRCGNQYEKRGLVGHALRALEEEIVLRCGSLHKDKDAAPEMKSSRNFRMRVCVELNGSY